MNILRKNWLVLTLFLIIFFTRLLILNKDAVQFWADEGRYPILIANLDKASKSGNYLLPIQQLFNIDARPGAGLFYYPVAFLEWKIPGIPFVSYYNLMVNTLSLIMVFLIVKKIQNIKAALVTTLILTFSIASFVYIRHTLPYDFALLLLLLGVGTYVYFQKSFVFGLLAGFSFLTYPSYYYYILPIPLMLILYCRSIKPALFFILGLSLILISIQFFSVAIDRPSYFGSLQAQSGGVTAIHQGDYMSAASFIGEYILAIDGYWNLFLILAIFPGLFLIKGKKKIIFFVIYLILVFLILETFSYILHKHVLYGRTVRPLYLLALVLAPLVIEQVLSNIKNKKNYTFVISIIILITFLNWLPRFLAFKNLLYPEQFKKIARQYIKEKRGDKAKIEEVLFANYFEVNSPPKMKIFKEFKEAVPSTYYIVNANVIYPYFGSYDLSLFCRNEVLLKEAHIQYKFRPYLFEGWNEVMREQSSKDPLYYQLIYCR